MNTGDRTTPLGLTSDPAAHVLLLEMLQSKVWKERQSYDASQVTDEGLLKTYEGLLTVEERAHMMEGSTAAVRKERLLARVLVRTTLSR